MKFLGRQYELQTLGEEWGRDRSSLLVLHGRRRIGKTRLLSEFSKGKSVFRFEGLEKGDLPSQLSHFSTQLGLQTKNQLLSKIHPDSFKEAFDLLTGALPKKGKHLVIFDEFSWMIGEDEAQVALFKYYWDNFWAARGNLMMVLCGSINSFMVKKVLFSSALYGRINREIKLDPLSLQESRPFLGPSRPNRDQLDLYLIFGGVPMYLEEIDPHESVVATVNRLCFTKDAFFVREFERLFRDEFKKYNVYAKIVESLAKRSSLSYSEILKTLKTGVGGGYRDYLDNLALANFAESFTPLGKSDTQLIRYRLIDEYLLFYFSLIKPNLRMIESNTSHSLFLNFLGKTKWRTWMGFAFERFCLKQALHIQKHLRIDQLVKNYGSYFSRQTTADNGLQIDLLFERHDRVVTLCEIKYTDRAIGTEIIPEIEKKTNLLTRFKRETIERVLITVNEPSKSLRESRYFHRILCLDDFFGSWA